jgi:hypothetical protein
MDRFEGEIALLAIEQYRVTHSQWGGEALKGLTALPTSTRDRYDLCSHQAATVVDPCPGDVLDAVRAWWGPIVIGSSDPSDLQSAAPWPDQ